MINNKPELNFDLKKCISVPCLPIEEGKYYFWNNFYVLSSYLDIEDIKDSSEYTKEVVLYPMLFNDNLPQSFIRFRASEDIHIGQIINSFIDGEFLYLSPHMKVKESDMKIIGWFLEYFSLGELINFKVRVFVLEEEYQIFIYNYNSGLEQILFCLSSKENVFGELQEIVEEEEDKINLKNVSTFDLLNELSQRDIDLKKINDIIKTVAKNIES